MVKKAIFVAAVAAGALAIGAPAFAATGSSDGNALDHPLISNVNVLSNNYVPTGNGDNVGDHNTGGNGNNIGNNNNGGNANSNGGSGNTVGAGNSGGVC